MPDSTQKSARTGGWYVLLLSWIVFAAAFFASYKMFVRPVADVTNGQLVDIGQRFGPFFGAGFGLLSFLATGLVYLIARLIMRKSSRLVALVLTMLGYAPWLLFGWDLLYREKRYTELARAIIADLGTPLLYASELVIACAFLGAVLTLIFKKRT